MPGNMVNDHLALMARSGLMTHIADLEAPVTADAMARFRADAAAQASNVMALASGRFALCLAPGTREVRTQVPHQLAAIGDARTPETPHPAPTRADPANASSETGQGERDSTIPGAPASADGASLLASLLEGQVTMAAAMDRMAWQMAKLAESGHAAQNVEPLVAPPPPAVPAPDGAALAKRVDTLIEQVAELRHDLAEERARRDIAQERLGEGIEAIHAAQMEALCNLGDDAQRVALAQAEESAHIGATLSTLRAGLRGLNDRLAELCHAGHVRHAEEDRDLATPRNRMTAYAPPRAEITELYPSAEPEQGPPSLSERDVRQLADVLLGALDRSVSHPAHGPRGASRVTGRDRS